MDKQTLICWIGISRSKFYHWQKRYGKVNEHNHWIPRDFWLQDWEKQAIVNYFLEHPGQGYRRLTYMMLDANIVAVSPSTTYRVLSQAGMSSSQDALEPGRRPAACGRLCTSV